MKNIFLHILTPVVAVFAFLCSAVLAKLFLDFQTWITIIFPAKIDSAPPSEFLVYLISTVFANYIMAKTISHIAPSKPRIHFLVIFALFVSGNIYGFATKGFSMLQFGEAIGLAVGAFIGWGMLDINKH